MMRYAELHGNMQMYRIKSLYGNTRNLAMNTDLTEKALRLANSPAVRMANRFANSPAVGLSAALRSPALQRMISMDERMREAIDRTQDKPLSISGKRLPLCEVICSCEPG